MNPNHVTHRPPTPAQISAGNYPKGKLRFQGLDVSIECPVGSYREWRDEDGRSGRTRMLYPYGYIRATTGADGEHHDCYVGPNPNATHAYVIDQMCPPAFIEFDEQKTMLGFDSADEARAAYLKHYDNPGFFGGVRAVPMEEFVRKVKADVLVKSNVRGHSRRLASGKTVFVMPYTDKRGHKGTDGQLTLFAKKPKAPVTPIPPEKAAEPERHTIDLFTGKTRAEDESSAARVTPQVASQRQLDGMVKIAADSIEKLRRSDVYRVLSEAPAHYRLALAGYIKKHRPDLVEEVDDVMQEMEGSTMSKSIILFTKSDKLSASMRSQIGREGSKHREKMPEDVFLEPGKRAYPVKVKRDGKWEYSKKLLVAAARDARMQGDEALAARADEIRSKL